MIEFSEFTSLNVFEKLRFRPELHHIVLMNHLFSLSLGFAKVQSRDLKTFNIPSNLGCRGTLPDSVSRLLTINGMTSKWQVAAHFFVRRVLKHMKLSALRV